MTNEDRIEELEAVVRAQGALIENILGWMRPEDPADLTVEDWQGRQLLDQVLEGTPYPFRNKWFGRMADTFGFRWPEHEQP
jgi:hypothetical protein